MTYEPLRRDPLAGVIPGMERERSRRNGS
jgi:hypothetical protein